MKIKEWLDILDRGTIDEKLIHTFGQKAKDIKQRLKSALYNFVGEFGEEASLEIVSAPGRTEIGGNHTDHQHGRVLAAAVNMDMLAVVAENNTDIIRVFSEGYPLSEVKISDHTIYPEEVNTTQSLIRGIINGFSQLGCETRGFNAYVTSTVLSGSGLSSSAAFEVLIGTIINELFYDKNATPIKIAQIGQYSENIYFGKPCGLMDQMASSMGNMITIDFKDSQNPIVEPIDFDFASTNHSLCIIDTGADHADLTDEYAAIPMEMKQVSQMLGKEFLRDVSEEEFVINIPKIRKSVGDRAVLRAMHFFGDNERILNQVQALRSNDFETFLKLVKESGRSSYMYLQNIIPSASIRHQEVALALAICEKLLGERGAFRVHGGGFAGTVLAFVPYDMLDLFKKGVEEVFGEGACHVLSVRPIGGVRL